MNKDTDNNLNTFKSKTEKALSSLKSLFSTIKQSVSEFYKNFSRSFSNAISTLKIKLNSILVKQNEQPAEKEDDKCPDVNLSPEKNNINDSNSTEKSNSAESDYSSQKTENTTSPVKQKSKARFVFANIFDVLASMVFISTILLFIKCQNKELLNNLKEFSDPSFLLASAIIFFLVCKILTIIIAQSKINKKLPSIILVMTLLFCLLTVHYKELPLLILFFLIFTLLFWICFNLSLEFTQNIIIIKAKIIIIGTLMIYISGLCLIDSDFYKAASSLTDNLITVINHLLI